MPDARLAMASGIVAAALAVITLWALIWLDRRIPRDHRAKLVIKADLSSFSAAHLTELISPTGYKPVFRRQTTPGDPEHRQLCFDILWRRAEVTGPPLDLLKLLNEHYSVVSFELTSDNRV